MKPNLIILYTALFISASLIIPAAAAKHRHVITFRLPDLHPESFTYDPNSHNFIIGGQKIVSVYAADGITETLISDTSLPSNSSFLGLAVDRHNHRLLACVHAAGFTALAAYDLPTRQRIFLTPLLPDQNPIAFVTEKLRPAASNDVAVDSSGNAYVTNPDGDVIWKVNITGDASILSKSEIFGINGVVSIPNGEYLLAVQSNTGKMYKVNVNNGKSNTVMLTNDLTGAEKIGVKKNGVIVMGCKHKIYYVKSEDNNNWEKGVVFDEIALDGEGGANDVTVGDEDKVYVLYGNLKEGIIGNGDRDEFCILEIEENKEDDDNIWLFVLVGFGLAYFLFWRFQMRRLVQNMDKRIA